MSNVRDDGFVHEGGEIVLNEAEDLRLKNQRLYCLILQLVSELDELEDALSVGTKAQATYDPK